MIAILLQKNFNFLCLCFYSFVYFILYILFYMFYFYIILSIVLSGHRIAHHTINI